MLRVENVLVDLCDACLDHDGPPLENRVGGLAVFPAVHVGLFVADPLESQGENRFAPMSLASDVGFNLYVYANSNPLFWIDPLGLCAESSGMDWFQGGLDAVGVVDPTGVADGLNALVYVGRGQYGNAAISAAGIIPIIGDLGKAGKYGAKVVNVTSKARSVEKALETGEKFVGKGYKEIAPGVYRLADGTRQFRMTGRDLIPTHGDIGSHVHYQKFDPVTGQEIKNIHTPLIDP